MSGSTATSRSNGRASCPTTSKIRSDRIDATAVLVADVSTGLYTGGAQRQGRQLHGCWRRAVRRDQPARPQDPAATHYRIAGTVTARSREIFNETARDFLGGNGVISANVSYGTDGVARVSSVRVAAPSSAWRTAAGPIVPTARSASPATAISDHYGPLSLDLSGTTSRPVAVVIADRPGFGVGLANLRAELRGTASGYALIATGESDYGPLDADLTILSGTGPLTIDVNKANLAGVGLAGRVVQSASGPFTGMLAADGSRHRRTGATARGRHLPTRDHRCDREQCASSTARPSLSIARAIANADVTLFDQPQVTADVQVAGLKMERFCARTRPRPDRLPRRLRHGQAACEGQPRHQFRCRRQCADVARAVARGADRQCGRARASVRSSRHRSGRITASTSCCPRASHLRDGSIQLAGHYGSDLVIQSRLNDVDLAVLRPDRARTGAGRDRLGQHRLLAARQRLPQRRCAADDQALHPHQPRGGEPAGRCADGRAPAAGRRQHARDLRSATAPPWAASRSTSARSAPKAARG